MATIRQWVAWAEQRIAHAVIAEDLSCGLCEVKQGPLTVTFRVRLLQPSPANLRKMLALAPTLAQVLQVEGVRVTDTAQGILIELPSPQPRTPTGQLLATHTHGLTVALGLDQWRQPVRVDLRLHPTLLFIGPPRRGKTSAMRSILYALACQNPPERFRYVIISQRRHDWLAFENTAGCLGLVTDPTEALQVMEWAVGRLMAQRSKHGRIGAAVIFVLDDLTNLLRRAPEIATPMGEIATMGGGVQIFLFIGTHHAGSKAGTGDSNLEASATARIVYKPSSATTGSRSAGAGGLGLDLLSNHQGDCLFLLDGYPSRIATGYTDDRLIVQLPIGNGVSTPWQMREQPGEQAESPEIQQNHQEQARTPLHVIAPVIDKRVGVAVFHAEQSIEQLKQNSLRLSTVQPPTHEEAATIQELYQRLMSIRKTVFAAYGHYNGKVRAYVLTSLAGIITPTEDEINVSPAAIDLAAKCDQTTLASVPTANLFSLPTTAEQV